MTNALEEIEDEEWKDLHERDLEDLSDAEITSKIKLSVKRRFDYPEWVLMFEYGAPGNVGRVCDCLAVNTLPSRNYKVVGFEFKASRSDWLRELKDGQKADYFVRLVDEWYVVAPKGVVEESEIPDGWGYLELKPNSEQLYKIRESDLTEHQRGDPDRRFWIQFMKQTVGKDSNYDQSDLMEAQSRGYREAKDELRRNEHPDIDIDRLRSKAESWDALRERADFLPWRSISDEDLETIELAGKLIQIVQSDRFGNLTRDIEMLRKDLERKTESMEESIDALKEGVQILQERVEESDPLDEAGGAD